VVVRIGDVRGDSEVGELAFVAVDECDVQPLDKARLYI
jgi:hypothetical protein